MRSRILTGTYALAHNETMMELVLYGNARTALAALHSVDEIKNIRDKAEAMAAYARQAKDNELIQYATEIKVRAEQRCGEMLRDQPKNKGVSAGGERNAAGRTVRLADSTPTLADLGLTRDESSRYQQLAAMSVEHFEAAIATAKATAGEITTAFMLREAKKATQSMRRRSKPAVETPVANRTQAKRSRDERVAEMTELVRKGHNAQQIAEQQGVCIKYVRKLLNGAGVKFTTPKRTRSIDSNKIARESVAALLGIAQGLRLARTIGVGAAEARALLDDLRDAMKALSALDSVLKELANGK